MDFGWCFVLGFVEYCVDVFGDGWIDVVDEGVQPR